jgi:DMSO/TMAO reductase YedYZ molybdopterin-dependent catalytic subunit
MGKISRRKLLTTGLLATAGATGLGVAAKLADYYGLIPPDSGVLYGTGETLNYAAHRLFGRHALAREFAQSQVSKDPYANPLPPLGAEFQRLEEAGFADWRLTVDGMVARPGSFSLAMIKSLPRSTQITMNGCEEGWTYIAEWSGPTLAHILGLVGALPQARYVVYRSFQSNWWDSIDIDEALHPQTLLAVSMNGGELPVPFGGPLRLRVPRQLGYKSIKFVTRLTVTDDVKRFGKGLGNATAERGYAWYAGI